MRTLILTFVLLIFISCKSNSKEKSQPGFSDYAGTVFKLDNIVDTSGKTVQLNFSNSDISVIDIWNTHCPPCIEEMKKFPAVLKEKKTKISIYSISVDQFYRWKPVLAEHSGAFAFMDYDIPNWKQYNLMTRDDPKFKNILATDRLRELDSMYNVKGNPAYFIIDRNGIILARPASAVSYLQTVD